MLTLAFNIQSTKAESGTVRIDNLIITTCDLEVAATRLAQWKNSGGIPSKVLNVTWIYSHYSGVDEPEKIRNCIKDFHSNFQTRYVTIFGDTDKVPIRFAYVPDPRETLVPTDLYYADLDYTWDDNGDGLYADLDNDIVDGVPDVYVGRIPPSFSNTAEDVVTKIIEYQQGFDLSQDWVNRVVLAAGMDGETTTTISEYISDVVGDKNVIKLYESAGNLTNDALDYEIDRGCIFLNFAGHSGETWFPGIVPDSWILSPIFLGPIVVDYEKYNWRDVLDRTNGRKLPVIVTMSCVSAKVDWTSILGGECLGEYFVMNPDGGAIAYFGSTGIAWCPPNGSAPYGLMGEMDRRVFEAFYDGNTRLGDMWGVALTEYLQHKQLNDIYNEKTVMEFILLGDPTLRIYNGPETLNVPAEYATIQGAINSAFNGDTIKVANGNYREHVVVNKTVSLIGESRYGTVMLGGGTGTVVYVLANNVNITGFAITGGDIGIKTDWRYGQNVKIIGNIIDDNAGGVQLYEVYDSTFADNQVSNNDNWGILLVNNFPRLSNNTIVNNVIWHNGYGIWLDNSGGNIIYHNNFVDNTQQVYIEWGNDTLDDGYPSGGNYWSDYIGVDVKNGPNQDQPSSDGIGDTPYIIDDYNRDRYPLMNPWGAPPSPSYTLTIYSSPAGVIFTVDAVSCTTAWSGTYSESASVSLEMPETHVVGEAKYYWSQWSDGVTSRSRTVTMNRDITLTAYYTGPYYELTVTSSPITGVTFTINGVLKTTPYNEWLLEEPYILVMPDTYTVGDAKYLWDKWNDGVTSRSRTVTMNNDISLTGCYTGPYYRLTVTSTPITGIPFTINAASKTSPCTEWLFEGAYTLEMPQTYNGYNWSHWVEDGDTNRIKTIYLHGTTWTGVYEWTKIVVPIKGGENATVEGNVTITNVLVTKNTLHFDASGPPGSIGWINVTFPMVNTTDIKVFINNEKLTPPPFPAINTNGTHYFIYFESTLSTKSITIQFAPLAPPVGGVWVPINKLELLAPWIGLASLITMVTISVVYVKHRKKQQN
jgi:parallel beta-helix repeat protein